MWITGNQDTTGGGRGSGGGEPGGIQNQNQMEKLSGPGRLILMGQKLISSVEFKRDGSRLSTVAEEDRA